MVAGAAVRRVWKCREVSPLPGSHIPAGSQRLISPAVPAQDSLSKNTTERGEGKGTREEAVLYAVQDLPPGGE